MTIRPTADPGPVPEFTWTGRGRLQCSVCGVKGYPPPDPITEEQHRWQQRCRAGHPYRCNVCGRRFTTAVGLSAHLFPRRGGGRRTHEEA